MHCEMLLLKEIGSWLRRWDVAAWLWFWSLCFGVILLAAGLYGSLADDRRPHLLRYAVVGAILMTVSLGGAVAMVMNARESSARRLVGILAAGASTALVLLILGGRL